LTVDKTIREYELKPVHFEQGVRARNWQPLYVRATADKIFLGALVDEEGFYTDHLVEMFDTTQAIFGRDKDSYVGSVVQGDQVWHVFTD
jgi:hypothetical protein